MQSRQPEFSTQKLGYGIQLVDWGCGQGVATLCFLESLEERGYIDRVQKITLIEPSIPAIERAKNNILQAIVGHNIEVEAINSKLPSDKNNYVGPLLVADLVL